MRSLKWVVALLMMLSTGGCAHIAVSNAKAALEKKLNPLLGKSEEDVLMEVGAPQSREPFGDVEVWRYFQSYGVRSTGYAQASGYAHGASAWGTGQTYESYDQYAIYFKNGKVVKWDGYVQR